jgi:TolB-like protein
VFPPQLLQSHVRQSSALTISATIPETEPIIEGLVDSMTSKLSNLDVGQQSLWIVPASVVRRRKVDDPAAALRDLGARLVVKGSIQRSAQDVRLTVNLIETKTLRQLGSAEMENRFGDRHIAERSSFPSGEDDEPRHKS